MQKQLIISGKTNNPVRGEKWVRLETIEVFNQLVLSLCMVFGIDDLRKVATILLAWFITESFNTSGKHSFAINLFEETALVLRDLEKQDKKGRKAQKGGTK